MLNTKDGSIVLGDIRFYGGMSFEEFLQTPYFSEGNAPGKQFWLKGVHCLGNRQFYVGLLFCDGLCQIKLSVYPGETAAKEKELHRIIAKEASTTLCSVRRNWLNQRYENR